MRERFGKFELEIEHYLSRVTIEDDQINNILKPILWPKRPEWVLLEYDYERAIYDIILPNTKIKTVELKDLIMSNRELLKNVDNANWREKFIKNQVY